MSGTERHPNTASNTVTSTEGVFAQIGEYAHVSFWELHCAVQPSAWPPDIGVFAPDLLVPEKYVGRPENNNAVIRDEYLLYATLDMMMWVPLGTDNASMTLPDLQRTGFDRGTTSSQVDSRKRCGTTVSKRSVS